MIPIIAKVCKVKMFKEEVGEKRDIDQQIPQQDVYMPPVFSKKIEVKLAQTLNNLKEKYSANIGLVKKGKKGNPSILYKTSSKCLIDFAERPREVLINTNTQDQEHSFDSEMQGLAKQFVNDYKIFTSNLSAEQRGQIRQDIQHFFDRRKLSENHCRKILPELTKQRFIYGVYFQDLILEIPINGEEVEAQHAQVKTLRQHHKIEGALVFENMQRAIYLEQLAKTINKKYFPAFDTQQQCNSLMKVPEIPIENLMPKPYLFIQGYNPSQGSLQRPPKLKIQSFMKIEEEYK